MGQQDWSLNMISNMIKFENYGDIVVVGCDGVGKTTFCTQLAERLNALYVKCSVSSAQDKLDFMTGMYAGLQIVATDHKIVFDRSFFPDDLIYSKIIEGTENDYKYNDWARVIVRMKSRNTLMIWLDEPLELITERFDARGDEFIKVEQLADIVAAYGEIMPKIAEQLDVVKLSLHNQTIQVL